MGLSDNEHAIAIGEKAVTFFNGLGVGLKNELTVGECRHQHDEGRLGKMKIGEQAVYQFNS